MRIWPPSRSPPADSRTTRTTRRSISAFEEYAHNSTHLRARLLLAAARQLAGWVKMPGERDCYARFEKDWIYN